MLLDLVRKLSSIDSQFSLKLSYSKDGVYSFTVESDDIGEMYSFSSTDLVECYSKIISFSECLEDSERFFDLIREIEEEPLGV